MIQINETILSTVSRDEYWYLSHLCNFVGKNNIAWPSNATMSERTGMGITTIKKVRKSLELKGLIKVTRRKTEDGKMNRSNLYQLTTRLISVYVVTGKNEREAQDQGVGRQMTGVGRHATQVGRQMTGGGSPDDHEALPNEALPKEAMRANAREATFLSSPKIEPAHHVTDPAPEKKKSSAKKRNQPEVGTEPMQAAESFVRFATTPSGKKQLAFALEVAGLLPTTKINLKAAAYSCACHLAKRHEQGLVVGSLWDKIPGYLKTQKIIDERPEPTPTIRRGGRSVPHPVGQAISDDTALRVAAELCHEELNGVDPLGYGL